MLFLASGGKDVGSRNALCLLSVSFSISQEVLTFVRESYPLARD